MIRRISIALLAVAGLSGCVSSGYGYRGGSGGGDYYYGGGSSYGVPYGYGSVGYSRGYGYGDPYYGYGGYGYPYYGYAPAYPRPRPDHGNEGPRRAVVPNKRISGVDYPPGATVIPNKPGLYGRDRQTRVDGGIGAGPARVGTNPKLDRGPRMRVAAPMRQVTPAAVGERRGLDRATRITPPASRAAPAPRSGGIGRDRIRDARP